MSASRDFLHNFIFNGKIYLSSVIKPGNESETCSQSEHDKRQATARPENSLSYLTGKGAILIITYNEVTIIMPLLF